MTIGIDSGYCRVCGVTVEWTDGRRLKRYCSNACRQRAYRERKAGRTEVNRNAEPGQSRTKPGQSRTSYEGI